MNQWIKSKPNENILSTCGEDGDFKSLILRKYYAQAAQSSNDITFN